jgi:hypothetical protein
LRRAGVVFDLHEYDYDPNAERIGLQAALAPTNLLRVHAATTAELC